MAKALSQASCRIWTNNADPGLSETGVEQGNLWLNTSTGNAFVCADPTGGAQVWNNAGFASPLPISKGGTNATGFTSSDGILTHNGTAIVNYAGPTIDSSGRFRNTTQPAFLAYLATTATNKTGNGTTYTLGTDALTEVFDQNGNFNTNGTFTAPVTGRYRLTAQITITGTTIATTFVISIVTTARTYTSTFTRTAASTDQTVSITALADMAATNTATVTIVASGEAGDTDDIKGGATLETFFCGDLAE